MSVQQTTSLIDRYCFDWRPSPAAILGQRKGVPARADLRVAVQAMSYLLIEMTFYKVLPYGNGGVPR